MPRLRRPQLGSLVIVTWVDPAVTTEWADAKDHANKEPVVCRSVGWVIATTASRLTIAPSRNSVQQWSESLVLPWPAIIGIQVKR